MRRISRISIGGDFLAPTSGRAIREMMKIEAETVARERQAAAEQQSPGSARDDGDLPKVEVEISAPHIQRFLSIQKKKTENRTQLLTAG